jgi:hypothetical protein
LKAFKTAHVHILVLRVHPPKDEATGPSHIIRQNLECIKPNKWFNDEKEVLVATVILGHVVDNRFEILLLVAWNQHLFGIY